MCLGSPFPSPRMVDEHPLQRLHSEWGSPLSIPGTCAWIPTKWASHHWSIMWWCSDDIGVFWMMTFTSVLKGYKRKNTWEGGGFQVLISQSKDPYLKCTLVCPSITFSRNFYKEGKIMCLVYCLIVAMCLGLDFGFHRSLCLDDCQDNALSSQR